MGKKNDREWREFEKAVARFLQALGPTAKVSHDVRLPDAHTGLPRQRDVWIEANLFGHFPVKVLVSCKRWKRVLHEGDIDHFKGEFDSADANLGVIYSKTGFNDAAVEKARKLNFSCCRLYENEPADLPQVVWFNIYCLTPRLDLGLYARIDDEWGCTTWGDVFRLQADTPDRSTTLLDRLVETYNLCQYSVQETLVEEKRFPAQWASECRLDAEGREPLRVRVGGAWNIYAGKVEAHLLAGSYNVTSGEFAGEQAGPTVDTEGEHPGPGWNLIEPPPAEIPARFACMVLQRPVRDNLLRYFESQLLPQID